jgi:hypothetical protein
MLQKKNTKGFTLIEILLWVIIVSIIMVSAFQALASIWVWKIRLIQKTQTQKQSLYFSEKLFEMIKFGWTVDFEEYFARKVRKNYLVASTYWTEYLSGHYEQSTGFWNYSWLWLVWILTNYSFPAVSSAQFYYCLSPNLTIWDGCYNDNNSFINGLPQAYWQYSFQFIDYNSNNDWDLGDEDWINGPTWDDDDEFLGDWPDVFTLWSDTKELYLINWVKKQRTFFRYNVIEDPDKPSTASCITGDLGSTYTGSGCLWTIQYLKLEWRDWWMDHLDGTWDSTEYDWVIDTWIISPDFVSWDIIAGSYMNSDLYRQDLFPDNLHVTEFKVFPHPNVDTGRWWKIADEEKNVSEYVRIQLWIIPAWKDRKKIKWTPKEYKVATTINLTDIFTR